MSASTAIYSRLSSAAAVTTAIGAARIYPQIVPESVTTYPVVAYQIDDEEDGATYGGHVGLTKAMVTIASIAATHKKAEEVAKAIRDALNGQHGTWGTDTVLGCWFEGASDSVERDTARNASYHVREQQFMIWIR